MCIGEAIVSLMQDKPLEKITVGNIAKRAGISRMTYYRYYGSQAEALEDYLEEMICEYLRENRKRPPRETFNSYSHILFSLEFFDQYAEFFLTMARAGLYSIMIQAINRFMMEQIPTRYPNSEYTLVYYAGALLNIFIKWEEDGRRVGAGELAEIISKFVAGKDGAV